MSLECNTVVYLPMYGCSIAVEIVLNYAPEGINISIYKIYNIYYNHNVYIIYRALDESSVILNDSEGRPGSCTCLGRQSHMLGCP